MEEIFAILIAVFGNVLGPLRAWVCFGHDTSKNKVKLAVTEHREKFAYCFRDEGGKQGNEEGECTESNWWEVKTRSNSPVVGPHRLLKRCWGLLFIWSSLPCCVLRLCLCSKVTDKDFSFHTSFWWNSEKGCLLLLLLLFFFFLGLSSYIVYVTGISTCRNLRVVSSQTLGCYRTCELPPVSGKFCMIDGGVGLSELGAGVPCIYETRDDELPGSAPVGSSSHLFSHLIGACNNIAQTL